MSTIIKKNGAFFTKNQDGLMAVSDPVELRDLTSGRKPYVDESYSSADKFSTPNVQSPGSAGMNSPINMAPQPQDQGTPYDKFNLALMGMLKDAQAQSGNMSANKNLASLQSQQAGQITGPVGEQFAGADLNQIMGVLGSRAGTYDPAINETSAVIQARNQKLSQFNQLFQQARQIGEEFAKSIVPDDETIKNFQELIQADPSKLATILDSLGNDKSRQKVLAGLDFSNLSKINETERKLKEEKMRAEIDEIKGKSGGGLGVSIDINDPNYINNLMDTTKGRKAPNQVETLKPIQKSVSVINQLESLQQSIGKTVTDPILGTLKSLNPYNFDARAIQAQLQSLVPNLARGVYGEVGVLTDSDIRNYIQTLPNIKGTKEQNDFVMAMTLKTVQRNFESQLETLASSGYDVSGFKNQYQRVVETVSRVENSLGIGGVSNSSSAPKTMKLPNGTVVTRQADGTYE